MCTVVQALGLCTGRTAHRGSRGIDLLFLHHGTRRGEGSASRPGRSLPPGKTRYPLYVQKAGWAPGPFWTGAENLASTGIRSPDRPARSQSLYPLSYPAHTLYKAMLQMQHFPNFFLKFKSSFLAKRVFSINSVFCMAILDSVSLYIAPLVIKILN